MLSKKLLDELMWQHNDQEYKNYSRELITETIDENLQRSLNNFVKSNNMGGKPIDLIL